jgi:membrane fusion protein, copper/silver efflux system
MKNLPATFNFQLSIFICICLLVSCTSQETKHASEKADQYTCSMHPQIAQDKPGTCPICGMELVKKSNGGNELAITDELKGLARPTNASVIATIKTTQPERKIMTVNMTAPGMIGYDTRKTYAVPIRFGGRIEKLFLKYNYQPIKKGEVIMEVYSPELLTAQRELLYVVQGQPEDKQLVASAKQKLFLLGLTDAEIENTIATGKETFAFPVRSQYSGYIVEATTSISEAPSPSAVQSASMGKSGMSGRAQTATSSSSPPAQISLREGMYVATGQPLFKVIDDTQLWAELYFAASDGKQIKKGQRIELHIKGSNNPITAQVDFIQPFFNAGEQFLQVRSYLNDAKNNYRVGQLVTANISQTTLPSLWVPKTAVLDLGARQIVFLKDKETFSPFKVKTGLESEGWVEIKEGLTESSVIAANAQYLVDSESFIKVINP